MITCVYITSPLPAHGLPTSSLSSSTGPKLQFQKGFQKGLRHDWIAFKVPGKFSDVFWG